MASLSELLNPVPTSKTTTPRPDGAIATDDDAITSDVVLAPELFQGDGVDNFTQPSTTNQRDSQSVDVSTSEDRRASVSQNLLDEEEAEPGSAVDNPQHSSEKRMKRNIDKKDTRHSSKNEGQHTDRRYLCYLCNKLFTRRRSVRDHLSKIHNTKTWEPSRSLEIVVEPESGEPLEPLEAQIARGGAAPAPPPRASKRQLEEEDEDENPEDFDVASVKPAETATEKPEPSENETSTESAAPAAPAPIIGKKRPFPINKKGMAKVKTATPNKRPRLIDSETRTPIRSPSVTSIQRGPVTKLRKATGSPGSSRAESVDASEPATSSAGSPESTNDDDGEVFCICRKGDNHTWMIACDGGCEEWYHGRCVNIRERDGDLIDKYVCPNCTQAGFHTTWKRMCRRKGCRKPARVFENPPSKYCGKDCGRLFFVDLLKRADSATTITRNGQFVMEMEQAKKKRKRRHKVEKKRRLPGDSTPLIDGSRLHTPAYSDDEKSDYETDSSMDDEQLPNRGGPLRAGELKAVLGQCASVDEFRELGRKPVTSNEGADMIKIDVAKIDYLDDFEKVQLLVLEEQKQEYMDRHDMLMAKETLLELVKKRSTAITEEIRKTNPKQKEICGFDPRLAWSDPEFLEWWEDDGGTELLKSGKVGPPPVDEDTHMMNGHDDTEDEDASGNSMPTKGGVCIKNRCQRHGSNRWQKAQLAELRFEQDLVRKGIERFEERIRSTLDSAAARKIAIKV